MQKSSLQHKYVFCKYSNTTSSLHFLFSHNTHIHTFTHTHTHKNKQISCKSSFLFTIYLFIHFHFTLHPHSTPLTFLLFFKIRKLFYFLLSPQTLACLQNAVYTDIYFTVSVFFFFLSFIDIRALFRLCATINPKVKHHSYPKFIFVFRFLFRYC